VSAVAAPRRRRRTQARRLMWLQIVAALFVTLLFLGPIVWMVSTAFKATVEAFSATPTWFFTPTLDNFSKVINGGSFLHPLWESFFAASVSTILALVLGTGIAYPLARYRLRGKQHLAFWILSLRIIPPIVTVVPVFLMVRSLGLAGSIWGLTILYTYINLPLTVWLLRGFYSDIPVEIEEAAHVDGAGRMRIFVGHTLPLAAPGIVATALLAFIFAWNEYLFANILTNASNQTLPVSLNAYVTPVSILWTQIMAAGTLVAIPVWFAALVAQRYLVRGLTLGAVK
jgi:ABC-type glycerol-3-phosphate transport system permease component